MTRYAAIDIGTNSVRLYVADVQDGAVEQVERDLTITRLGQGVDAGGRLALEAVDRTVAAVGEYWDRCRAHGISGRRARIAATSAVRDAANREEFLAEVRARTGLEPDVLSGDEEASLSFAGAVAELAEYPGPYCVVDIGGGSTEIAVGEQEKDAAISIDIGSVRLTERLITSHPTPPEQIAALEHATDSEIEKVEAQVDFGRASTLVGVAGTITTLSAIALDLPGYDRAAIHHSTLTHERVLDLGSQLAAMTLEQRRRLPAMPRGREDVIVAGAVILERIMLRFGFDRVVVSEADILDGLLATLW